MNCLPGISDKDCHEILKLLCSIYRLYLEIYELELHALERMCDDVKDNDV